MEQYGRLLSYLAFLYGEDAAPDALAGLVERMDAFREAHPEVGLTTPGPLPLTEADAILITYGDQVQAEGRASLDCLSETLDRAVGDLISTVHILPFFPYSSDDGFSVIDYTQVNPDMGDWRDVATIARTHRMMYDLVVNHCSRENDWFRAFCEGDAGFEDAFIVVDPDTDLSGVTRPRALPLLTAVDTKRGVEHVWTTFSEDQIDINFGSVPTMLRIIDVLLFYVAQGATIIRLDAIAYLWKEIGTTCIHLPQTHVVVKLMREVLDRVAPDVILITETNVPHEENISYFGQGTDEAQLVYQFPLPPLTMHAVMSGTARHLTKWAQSLELYGERTSFYNFTASHDGVGLRPLEGILSDDEVWAMAETVLAHGGKVSYKNNPDGSQSPYELNVSYFDALSDPKADEPLKTQVDRFVVSQAIPLALQGVPAIYFHSLFGSRNDLEGMARTGRNRSINREKLQMDVLLSELANPDSLRAMVLSRYKALLAERRKHVAFHPQSAQEIVDLGDGLFTVLRVPEVSGEAVLCIHNVTGEEQSLTLPEAFAAGATVVTDLLSGAVEGRDESGSFELAITSHEVLWLRRLA